MARIEKSYFQIGIYKPEKHPGGWPWHCYYEDGVYLSAKYRPCGINKAAEFDTRQEAREFFHNWRRNQTYRMELLEVRRYVTVPDPVYPPEHPRSILKAVRAAEPSTYYSTALFWFSGDDISELWSKATLTKHRTALLAYGIDIFCRPTEILQPHVDQQKNDEPTLREPKLLLIKGARKRE